MSRPNTPSYKTLNWPAYTGAAALLSSLPPTKALLADRGHDADWLGDALGDRKIEACIPL